MGGNEAVLASFVWSGVCGVGGFVGGGGGFFGGGGAGSGVAGCFVFEDALGSGAGLCGGDFACVLAASVDGGGSTVWGIRCGQINMNDATQGAAVVGVEREHWIGSVQILSGNIAVRDQIAGGLFGQRVVTNGWAGGAVGLADFVGFAGGGWGGGGDGDVDDVCAVVGGVCGVGIVAGSLGGAAGVACGVEGEEERAGGVLCGVWV